MCVLGAFGMLTFSAACEIKNSTGGTAGDGGTGGDDATGGMGGTGGTGMGGMGGMGGAMVKCYEGKCAEYITVNPEEDFCDDNPSKATYDALAQCTCDLDMNPATGGKCATQCADEACAQKPVVSGGECEKCITDTAAGCGNEFNMCSNDF
jgi:hypothetical protein